MSKTINNAVAAPEMSPVVPGSNRGLVDLRNDLLTTMDDAGRMVDLKISDYVTGLNLAFTFDWFYIEHKDLGKTPEGKTLRTEKTALFDALKARKHSNPSTFWSRLCAKACDVRYPELAIAAAADAAAAATTEDTEGSAGAGSRNRTPLVRNGEEITALIKFNENLDLEGEFASLKEVTKLLKEALSLIYSAKITK